MILFTGHRPQNALPYLRHFWEFGGKLFVKDDLRDGRVDYLVFGNLLIMNNFSYLIR
jgi:hypothetical protein